MRGVKVLIAGTALLSALVVMAEPSFAEGLLRRLFGGFVGRVPEYRFDSGRMGQPPGFYPDEAYGGYEEDFNTYRTLCVRLCDGFYFPISDGVRRERLYSDSHQCSQRCDGEARLFYYPTNGGSPETMVDLTGRRYADLPNAFRYRKTLVSNCTCKPAPWSEEAAALHERYAAEAAAHPVQTPIEDAARRTAQASRSPYDGMPPRGYGRGAQTPWNPPGAEAGYPPGQRPAYGWDHD